MYLYIFPYWYIHAILTFKGYMNKSLGVALFPNISNNVVVIICLNSLCSWGSESLG